MCALRVHRRKTVSGWFWACASEYGLPALFCGVSDIPALHVAEYLRTHFYLFDAKIVSIVFTCTGSSRVFDIQERIGADEWSSLACVHVFTHPMHERSISEFIQWWRIETHQSNIRCFHIWNYIFHSNFVEPHVVPTLLFASVSINVPQNAGQYTLNIAAYSQCCRANVSCDLRFYGRLPV